MVLQSNFRIAERGIQGDFLALLSRSSLIICIIHLSTVYYRLYEANGMTELRRPAYSNNHFVGRVLSNAVTPPHTADSLKKHLINVEGFSALENSCLLVAYEPNCLGGFRSSRFHKPFWIRFILE